MNCINNKTEEAIKQLSNAGITISMTTAARILGMSSARQMQAAAERNEFPFTIEITYYGESKRRFRVITERFIQYLLGMSGKEQISSDDTSATT